MEFCALLQEYLTHQIILSQYQLKNILVEHDFGVQSLLGSVTDMLNLLQKHIVKLSVTVKGGPLVILTKKKEKYCTNLVWPNCSP